MPWTMYNSEGSRKYLTKAEISSFLNHAKSRDVSVRSFCWIMAVTGCRISEALALTDRHIDFGTSTVIIECLKKRGKRVFRAIPLPKELLAHLRKWLRSGALPAGRLWPWSRMTGYRRICEVMGAARIFGAHASPKGLRHGFGVNAVQCQVPLNFVQKWLGHADMKTTAIYTSAVGPEERDIAARMWSSNGAAGSPDSTLVERGELSVAPVLYNDQSAKEAKEKPLQKPPFPPGFGRMSDASSSSSLQRWMRSACVKIHFWLKRIEKYLCFSLSYPFFHREGQERRVPTLRGDNELNPVSIGLDDK